MDIEEATHLLDDVIEGPRLVPVGRLKGVAMHRITHPGDFTAGLLHPRDHLRKDLTHIACAHPGNECDPARLPSGVKTISELDGLLWRGGGAQLDAQGVAHPSQQLDVGPVELAGALPDPQHVPGAAVELLRAGVDAGHGPLILQQQRLV